MRIVYMSDLHLEFGPLSDDLPDGDVLLLDGDITLLNSFDRSSEYYHAHALRRDRTEAFLERCRASFNRIYYVIGNHEAYGYNISKAPSIIRRWKGVTLLENKSVDLGENTILVGGTLWTDMNQGRDAAIVGGAMNDFRVVSINDGGGQRIFRPADAMARFRKTTRFIAKTAEANPGKTIVVVTHHAPSIQGINPAHSRSHYNAGYYTDLSAFIADHPNIRYWVHGHTHIQKIYRVHQCTVMSNARGYIGQEHSADVFKPNRWFDPVSGEVSHRRQARMAA